MQFSHHHRSSALKSAIFYIARIRNLDYISKGKYAIHRSLLATDLEIYKVPEQELKSLKAPETLLFGHNFTDHMLIAEWKDETSINTIDSLGNQIDGNLGWSKPKIKKYEGITLPPSASVFHYGTEVFEGMKAYKDQTGRIRLFRPLLNMFRLQLSASRLALPAFDEVELLSCIKELLKIDSRWIPTDRGYSLYIRPTIIGTQDSLGVSRSNRALLFTICSPVGPYYRSGFKAITLFAEEHYVRSWPGGVGAYKAGGNYAPTILPQAKASQLGFQQNLWLLGQDLEVTEVGSMNIFVFWENENGVLELITPALDGTILPGVTRSSVLELAKSWGEFSVVEGKFTIYDIEKASKEKRLKEVFGTGTAVIISPVKSINFRGVDISVPLDTNEVDSQAGPLAKRLWSNILDIQYGLKEFQGWSTVVD